MSSTALCSVFIVTMCLPFLALKCAAPLIARLSDSVAPEVQTISRGSAPSTSATSFLAFSTRSSACQPNGWLREEGLPKTPWLVRHSAMLFATRSSTGVVAE